MKRTIIWEKWQDPTAPLVDRWLRGREEDEDDPAFLKSRGEFGDHDVDRYDANSEPRVGPAVFGPVGVIPLRESNLPGKLFNFWMGHADFDLSAPVVDVIKRVPGVETLDVFARYRFRMAVGKAFREKDVMRAVEAAVQPPAPPPVLPPEKAADPLGALKRVAAGMGKEWAILRLANGTHGFVAGQTADEVKAKAAKYDGARVVAASWEAK